MLASISVGLVVAVGIIANSSPAATELVGPAGTVLGLPLADDGTPCSMRAADVCDGEFYGPLSLKLLAADSHGSSYDGPSFFWGWK